jgi:hypothetical protein
MFKTYNVSGVIFAALFRRLVVIKRKVNTNLHAKNKRNGAEPLELLCVQHSVCVLLSSATFMSSRMRVRVLSEEVTVERRYQCWAH